MARVPVAFGQHVFDPAKGILQRGTERCTLQCQPAQLLELLIECAGEIVTREQIRERLWPTTTVDYDQGINFAIRHIRVALGPDAHAVQTVPRKGYRFVGALSCPAVVRGRARRRRTLAIAAALVVALGGGFGVGIVTSDSAAGRFVYVHLVHPDRCPYIRALMLIHRNS